MFFLFSFITTYPKHVELNLILGCTSRNSNRKRKQIEEAEPAKLFTVVFFYLHLAFACNKLILILTPLGVQTSLSITSV